MQQAHGSNGFTLVRWVGLAMGLPALIAVALLGKDALMVAERINDSALKRETAALERGLKLLGDLHASEILALSMWDSAFRNIVVAKRPDWIRKNFGREALSSEGVQQFVLVDAAGKAIFSSDGETAPSESRIATLMTAAAPSMERARKLYRAARASGEGFGERMPGAMTDGIYVNDIIRLDGHPAMVTVSPITPDTEEHAAPKSPTLLLGVQLMTEALFDKLESLSHIDGLEHVSATHTAETGEHAHALRDQQGNIVTHVTWELSSPGYVILRAALPAIALSLGLIALMTMLAAVTMRRLTRRLAESEQAAVYSARHDAATGLANRGWFMRVFAGLLTPAGGRSRTYAVLLIDCDFFKTVNDTLGHAAGDAVLAAIAARLKSQQQGLTIAARLGGDEFAVLSAPLREAAEANHLVHRIEIALMRPVLFESHAIDVSVSIGAAVLEAPSTQSIDVWLAQADMALYRAKREGRGCARLYDSALDRGQAGSTGRGVPANDQRPAPDRAA